MKSRHGSERFATWPFQSGSPENARHFCEQAVANLRALSQLNPLLMNPVHVVTPVWLARILGFQATPVNPSLCAHPPGAGLVTRTRDEVRCGLALLLVAGGLTAGSTGLRAESSPVSTIHLDATLVSPIDVVLEWKDASPVVASHTVEYATDPKGPYIILSFCPPGQTTYKHPNLMPQTTFYYRVRALYGPATNQVDLTLPGHLSDQEFKKDFFLPEDYSWAAPKTLPDNGPIVKRSLRDAATFTAAGPTDLKASFVPITVSGIQLTWTNHSSDEDGFLLEEKTDVSPDFKIFALIQPKINAFGWAIKPPERKVSIRIRAFYYGTPSNLEKRTTVLPSEWKNPAAKLETPAQPAN
jgi:hypothetical protein